METSPPSSDHGPVDRLAEEFLERHRRGERPEISEYAGRHPGWADEIREVFPALLMMEQLKPPVGEPTGSHARAAAGPGRPPGRLGEYRILREIGRGGMGVVYEAIQEPLGRHVALKVLPRDCRTDPGLLERFRLEASSAARLHHTNIVPVFGVGEHDGVHYYSMQFIRGTGLDVILRDLRRLRAQGPQAAPGSPRAEASTVEALTVSVARAQGLAGEPEFEVAGEAETGAAPSAGSAARSGPADGPPNPGDLSGLSGPSEAPYFRSVARIGAQVADALAYAHSHQVLHRDIKPSNLLLDAEGRAWVADFGLAKLEGAEGPTRYGDIVGTVRYMAPERFEGRSDALSDVYGLGATLYELLTLRPAFEDIDRPRLIDRVRHEPVTPPRKLDPEIPRDLETIVLKALARDPADRFPTARALAEELGRFRDDRPILSRRARLPERAWRWCRRNRTVAALLAVASGLTVAVAVVSTTAAFRLGEKNQEIGSRLSEIKAQRDRISRSEADAQQRLVEALAERARAGRYSHRFGQRFGGLEALKQAARIARASGLPAERIDSLRDQAIACLALPDLEPRGRVIRKPPNTMYVAFAASMDRYALRFVGGDVVVRRTAGDGELSRFKCRGDHDIHIFHFSPDGRYLATTQDSGGPLIIWDVEKGTVALEKPGPVTIGFSPDSRSVGMAHSDGEISLYELATDRLTGRWHGPVRTSSLAYHPDGTRVAVVASPHAPSVCHVFDVPTGRVIRSWPLPSHASSVTWSPDGHTLSTACDSRTYFWDAETGIRKLVLEGTMSGGQITAYDPSGLLWASNSWESRLRIWDPLVGRPVLDMPGGGISSLTIGPDGRVVTLVEDELATYRIDPALEYRTLIRTSGAPVEYARPSVRGDGRLLAVGTSRGVLIFDLARGRELCLLDIGLAFHACFEASGDMLTSGSMGVWRWPVRPESDGTSLSIGPPTRLLNQSSDFELTEDRSGRVIALANINAVHLLTDGRESRIGRVERIRYASISPDGRWLATGEHAGGVQVWRLSDAVIPAANLACNGLAEVAFSPDEKWLYTNGEGCRLWEVGTWREARRVGGVGRSFSPDGRILVVQDPSRMIRLVETGTGRTVARLESPDLCDVRAAAFSPDGSRLIITTNNAPAVHVWDLRAIRGHLAEMGLDWDAPPYPDHDPAGSAAPPLTVASVDLGPMRKGPAGTAERSESVVERTTARLKADPEDADALHERGHALERLGRYEYALADFDAALRKLPGDARLLKDRAGLADAWYRRGKELGVSGLGEAGRDAYREAVRIDPGHADAQLEFGRALRMAARMDEAAEVLARAVQLRPDSGWFRQAFAWALLGREHWAEAAEAYREAIRLGRDGDADAHFELGIALRNDGSIDEAIAEFARVQKLLPPGAMLASAAAAHIQETRRLAGRLPAVLRGEDRVEPAERLALARLAKRRGLVAASASLFLEVLRADPPIAIDPGARVRYDAACAAALAGCGAGKDDPPPDDAARAGLRGRALGWLKADLAAWSAEIGRGRAPAVESGVRALERAKSDPDLAGLRDEAELAKLPEEERRSLRDFWGGVDSLLQRSGPGKADR